MIQLFLTSSQPTAMIVDDLTETADIVHEARRCGIGFRPDYSCRPDKKAVHVPSREAERHAPWRLHTLDFFLQWIIRMTISGARRLLECS